MIAAHLEPKGLNQNTPPMADFYRDGNQRALAITGSLRLRNAILAAKGHAVPVEPVRSQRAQISLPPRHEPECCSACGAPLKLQSKLISNIQATVASYFKLDPVTMRSARQTWDICHPRQIAMYLASELTAKSLSNIGRQFGGRDHTTVIHAIRAVKRRMEADCETALDVEVLRLRLADAA